MEENFKKARRLTATMIAVVIVCGIIALMISDGHGYGASSEAKMNFLRAIVFFVSAVQIVLALALRKMAAMMSKNPNPARMLTLQMMINAFCEAIAFFGLGLVFISKTFMDYAVFGALSLAAFAFFFPKQNDWNHRHDAGKAGV